MKYLIQLLRVPEPARAQALMFHYQNTWNICVEKTSEFEFWVKNFKLFSQTFDAMDEDGYLYACYYVSLIVIGSFFVLNLVLGVLSGWVLRINCFHHKIHDRVTDTRQTLDARVRKNWSQMFFKISLLASHAIIVIIVFITYILRDEISHDLQYTSTRNFSFSENDFTTCLLGVTRRLVISVGR